MITRPDATDGHAILQLLQACRRDLEAQGVQQWDDLYPNREVVEEDIHNQNLYIKREHDHIAGVISYDNQMPEEYKSIRWEFTNGPSIVLHRLAIAPSHQGRGYAKELVQFVHARNIEELFTSVRLDVYSGNPLAVGFYQRLGYVIRGEVMFPRRPLPFYCMEKEL